jgi:hypothetical protein
MTSKVFSAGTVIDSPWLNDVNDATYNKLNGFVSPYSYGALGDGVNNDGPAIQSAVNASRYVRLGPGTFKINATINLPAGTYLDMAGANIVLNTGATPGFSFASGNAGLYMMHGGGVISGTASAFLFCQGTTNQPTLQSQYASQIHLESVLVSSTTITNALQFSNAVKSVYINGANFFTPNGIIASGKCVEVAVSNSIIYGATGIAGTRGIQLRSTGGTTFYNEGWSIVNTTVDNFEISHDITDVFVYQVIGGFHGVNPTLAATTGYTFQFQAPSTNLCQNIFVSGGAEITGRTRFAASGGGIAYQAKLDAMWLNVPGTAIAIENNASNITVTGDFSGGTGTAIGVVGTNNNNSIRVINCTFDSTYNNGAILNGAAGTNCALRNLSGPTIGDIIGLARANVLVSNVKVTSSALATLKATYSPSNLTGSIIVGGTVGSLTVAGAAGETGKIILHIGYTGGSTTQTLQINLPAGVSLRSGTGWASANQQLGIAAGLLETHVEYYATADFSGTLSVTNQAGNTITLANQCWIAMEKDWN